MAIEKYGEPPYKEKTKSGPVYGWRNGVNVLVNSKKITAIEIAQLDSSTHRGISLGNTIIKLVAAYGENYEKYATGNNGYDAYRYRFTTITNEKYVLNINVRISTGEITAIYVYKG